MTAIRVATPAAGKLRFTEFEWSTSKDGTILRLLGSEHKFEVTVLNDRKRYRVRTLSGLLCPILTMAVDVDITARFAQSIMHDVNFIYRWYIDDEKESLS